MTPLRRRTLATFTGSRPAEARGAHICCVFQHSPHGRAIPPRLAGGSANAFRLQPTTDFSDRQTVAADPFENLFHHGRLVVDHFVRGRTVTFQLPNFVM